MQYRKEVDGLRALAVLPVLFFHAGFATFSGGYVGVDVFFVISGYLITSLILDEKANGRFTIANFYERRARRILPALFVVMAATIVPAWLRMTPENLENFGQSLVAVSLFANNVLLALTSGYFAPAVDEKPLLHTWSLAVEEQYYVVFPLFITLCWGLGRRWLFALIGLIAAVSLGVAEFGWRNDPQTNFYYPFGRAWELLLGAMTAFHAFHAASRQREGRSLRIDNALALLGVLLVLYAVFFYVADTPFPSLYTLVPVVGTALILHSAHEGTFIGRVFGHRYLVGIGLISYSLYLWHQPLLAFARLMSSGTPDRLLMSSLLLLSVVLAYMSWRYVEKPFRNRRFLSRNAIFALSAVVSALFIGLGLAADFTNGFPKRMSTAYLAELAHFKRLSAEREPWLKPACYLTQPTLSKIPEAVRAGVGCRLQEGTARILVVGDSHANDKAMALRLNGLTIDQVVESDCSLAPSRMAHKCHKLMNVLKDYNLLQGYDVVLLANRWGDLREVALFDEEFDFWSAGGAKLTLLGPMPEYGKLPDRMSFLVGNGMTRPDAAGTIHMDERLLHETDTALAAVAQRQGIRWLDSAALFCGLSAIECSPIGDDQIYYVVDYAHLSVAGARQLGARIIAALQLH